MAPGKTPSDSSNWLADAISLLFSGSVHFAALILLGLITAASQQDWQGLNLQVKAGDADASSFDDDPLQHSLEIDLVAEPLPAAGTVQMFDDLALPATDFAALTALALTSAEQSGLEGLAVGESAEDGETAAASTEFFGVGGYGQSFVYVVDCSDSMNEAGKFDRARYELMQSIEQLASDQRYFVIFFNDGAHPMDANELVLATKKEVARTAEWVGYVEARGGTYPLPALLFALSLRPDAVYFLSDGQFDPMTIAQIRYRNRPNYRLGTQPIPIHTIAFVDRATERLMRAIAGNSGGEYRFVQ
jgi:hypothetical protein